MSWRPPGPQTFQTERLIFLDWVRIIAFAVLVFYHVGMVYVTWDFHIKSPHASTVLEPWMRLSSPWRMDLLFLVSGAATSFMLLRGGASSALLRLRARRLMIPLAFGMLVVVPPQSWLEVVQKLGYGGDYFDFMRLYLTGYKGFCFAPGRCLMLPTWNHLWFLPYLFFYTLLLWLWLRWRPDLLDRLAGRLPSALRGAGLLLWPIMFLAVSRLALRAHFPVTHALADDWFAHSQYLVIFLLGAVLARAPLLWQRMAQVRWLSLALALVAWGMLVQGNALSVANRASMGLTGPLVYSTQQWCAMATALGFAHVHLNRDGPIRRYLTEAVFPVYILHQTVILLLAFALAPATLEAWVEGPLLVLGTFAVSFVLFEIVKRLPWVRPLFGLKRAG